MNITEYQTEIGLVQTETEVNAYPDQTNITVEVIVPSGNRWSIQTNARGKYAIQDNCLAHKNDVEWEHSSDNKEFDVAVEVAETIATAALS